MAEAYGLYMGGKVENRWSFEIYREVVLGPNAGLR